MKHVVAVLAAIGALLAGATSANATVPPNDDLVSAFVLWAASQGTPVAVPACHRDPAINVCYGIAGGDTVIAATVTVDVNGLPVAFTRVVAPAPPTIAPTTAPVIQQRMIEGTFTLIDSDVVGTYTACSGGGGYDDFGPGMNITVRDGSGAIVGSGGTESLPATTSTQYRDELNAAINDARADTLGVTCVVHFSVTVAQADFYSVEIGSRGDLSYSLAELEETDWWIELSLS